jgi:16S rRNA G966 N2-methylase RsmD
VARLPIVVMCPAGFEHVVAAIADRDLSPFELSVLDSGYVRAATGATLGRLRDFPCATNVFHVLGSAPRSTLAADVQHLSRSLRATERPDRLPRRGSFRLRVHDDGRFATLRDAPVRALEAELASWSGLQPARNRARTEFWVIRRRGLVESVLATKLTAGNPRVPPGVLRPEVCAALARVVQLEGAPLAMDPFAGSGAVGVACLRAGARSVWLNDPNPAAMGCVDTLSGSLRARVETTAVELRDLVVSPASVSAIVTDPPWGHYEGDLAASVVSLYEDLAHFAVRTLVTGGPLVVLTGAGPDAVDALGSRKELVSAERFPVLINGRKAQIVVAARA